jgi:streptogramin lyase
MGSTGSGPGQFASPHGITVDATGVYVADVGNNRVQKLDSSGSPVASWGSSGSDDGQLDQPWGIVATGGSVWVSEWGNYRVQKFSQAGAHQVTVGSPLGAGDYYWPADVTTTPSGAVYVADGTHDIQRLDAAGNPVARWVLADFANGIAVTASGVYATRTSDHVSRFDETGALLGQFGGSGSGPGQFNAPVGIAADEDGNLYVADANNNRVQKLSPAGAPLATFGSAGPGAGHMYSPHDVALDSAGNVYVADSSNGRIDKFSPAGDFLTMWGTEGSADGQLSWPGGLVVDRTGHVFVSDSGNDRIQEFDANGNFIARWGALGAGPGELSDPAGITIDADGAVWVADGGNHRIVRSCCPAAQGGPAIGGGAGNPSPAGGSGQPSPGGATGGADRTPPRITLSGRASQRTRKVRRRGLVLRVGTNEGATFRLRAVVSKRSARLLGLRSRTVGRAAADLGAAGTRGMRLRLSARARRALPRLRAVKIVVRASAADPAGNRSGAMRAILVRR